MRLEAILSQDDLRDLIAQLMPVEIRLGDSAMLTFEKPTQLSLVANEGISIVCDATLHWPILGMDLPVRMRALKGRIHPKVRPATSGDVLAFELQIEHAGVSLIPAAFEDRVTALLNQELVSKHIELAWNYRKTLTHVFALPAALLSASGLSLGARIGAVTVTESEIRFVVEFGAEVQARPPHQRSSA